MAIRITQVNGPFTIGGKTFKNGVSNVVIGDDGKITINGKPVEDCDENVDERWHIHVAGNIDSVVVSDTPIVIEGKVGDVIATNGSVNCSNIEGDVRTDHGSVNISGDVKGSVDVHNGSFNKMINNYYNK